MLFNSYIFVFLFLPVALVLYHCLNFFNKSRIAKATLIIMSLWFYAYFHLSYIFIILSSIIVNFVISGIIRSNKDRAKLFLSIGVVFNVLLIFYYKYLDFTFANLNFIFKTDIPMLHILMPLGISFFTFQQIGYLVDTYNELIEDHNFLDYVLFVTFFPQLIAGPIVSYNEMVPQFNDETRKHWNYENFALGLFWFTTGLAKKVLIADKLGRGSDWAYANVVLLNGPEVILTFLLYTLRLYFDFSGYCDMACGIAKMFGIDLPINFLSPLKSLSIMEYWNKWHITLGRFLTGYVFNPMVTSLSRSMLSNRNLDKEKKKRRKANIGYLSLFLTFLISGIWHGANWTFIAWGVLQGTGRVLYQIFRKRYDKWPSGLRWTINFVFTIFSQGLFGAYLIKDFGICLSKLGRGWAEGIRVHIYGIFNTDNLLYIEQRLPGVRSVISDFPWINITLMLGLALGVALLAPNIYEMKKRQTGFVAVSTIVLLVMSVLSMTQVSTFLYFNF